MRCLIVDAEHYRSSVTMLSTRGVGEIVTDPTRDYELIFENVTLIFVTVERRDTEKDFADMVAYLKKDKENVLRVSTSVQIKD